MLIMIKLAAIAALCLWVYLFSLLAAKGGGSAGGSGGTGKVSEMTQAEKTEVVTEIMENNPALAKCLMRQSGLGHLPLKRTSPKLVDELARRATIDHLQVLQVAGKQQDLDFDLDASRVKEEVNHPTNDIEPVSMRNFDQLAGVLPMQLVADDDEFYRRLANSELTILQPYTTTLNRKTLYILMDVSQSMEAHMNAGVMRHTWSRAVALSLLLKAVKSEANYLGRPFDGQAHDLWKVEGEAQAEQVMDFVINHGASGGGTDIGSALAQACADVAPLVARFGSADVLLITDGQDDSLRESAVRKMLGTNINLHVASIGCTAPAALVACATTYKEFK